jgi:hypothetical protein
MPEGKQTGFLAPKCITLLAVDQRSIRRHACVRPWRKVGIFRWTFLVGGATLTIQINRLIWVLHQPWKKNGRGKGGWKASESGAAGGRCSEKDGWGGGRGGGGGDWWWGHYGV